MYVELKGQISLSSTNKNTMTLSKEQKDEMMLNVRACIQSVVNEIDVFATEGDLHEIQKEQMKFKKDLFSKFYKKCVK